MMTKQGQVGSLKGVQEAVAASKRCDPGQGSRDHHRRGLARAEEFIADFQAACSSSTALDFDLGLKLQQLLCFQSFEEVFRLGQRLGDRGLAFVTALEKVTLSGEARPYHNARFRYYVLYLAASRSEALAFLDETFTPLTNEEERRWIEMLRIVGPREGEELQGQDRGEDGRHLRRARGQEAAGGGRGPGPSLCSEPGGREAPCGGPGL